MCGSAIRGLDPGAATTGGLVAGSQHQLAATALTEGTRLRTAAEQAPRESGAALLAKLDLDLRAWRGGFSGWIDAEEIETRVLVRRLLRLRARRRTMPKPDRG
jgi:hypothetical protein